MTLVDTSAWIEFFRRKGRREVKNRVAAYIEIGAAAHCGPVEFELLTGAQDSEVADIRQALKFSVLLDFPRECWQRAAAIEKVLRSTGVTVPRDDVFVAAVALHHQVEVYACDPHFRLIESKGGVDLRLVP
jgi:predicted nucleic acid-binding protein